MTSQLQALIDEAKVSGTLSNLPSQMFIDGAWVAGVSGQSMETYDPGTGKAFAEFAAGDAGDVEAAIDSSAAAFKLWSRVTPAERSSILLRAASMIRENADLLSVVESMDSGKSVTEAQGDIAGCARLMEYYAGAADKLQGETIPLGPNYLSYTQLEPVGVTAHIIPWNYPSSTMIRGIAPALAAGCTAIVKPAETTPLTALLFADILHRSGLPKGVCNVVTGLGSEIGAPLVAHSGVHHVTFTGSVATGVNVMKAAAENVNSVTLELGGKCPVVVLADCDIDAAVEGTLWAIFSNAGQICSAGSRLVIERSLHAQFMEKLVAKTQAISVGHGLYNPDMGAINSKQHLAKVAGFVEDAKSRGVSVATGGNVIKDPRTGSGWFFQPTIFDNVAAADAVVQEEIFGPVLAVQVADSVEHAVDLANDTPFGLAAGIYTQDISKAHAIARDLDVGQIYVNEYYAGGVEVPFGGNKLSGIGREKGLAGLTAYSKIKAVTTRV